MPYNSYNIYLSGISSGSPKNNWIDDYSKYVEQIFYDSYDWFTIQQETSFGSGTYSDTDVKVNYVINPSTGDNMGDDWKILIFPDITKKVYFGTMFYFDDNYWITVNVENIKSLTSSCIVRRCNNSLRWMTDDGYKYSVPCVLDYQITENRNYASAMSAVVNPSGMLPVICQMNDKTNTIRPNQRFLFGNANSWIGYKVQGGGLNNFNNHATLTNSSNGMLTLTMAVDHVNLDTDDLVNGIADVNEHVYTIFISGALTGQVGTTSQLVASVYLNDLTVDRNVTWASDDETIATVSSSGLVTFVSEGSANITATLENNSEVYDTEPISATLASPNEYTIVATPDTNLVLQGVTQVFDVRLYLDGVLQADTFTFTLVPNTVPSSNYVFTAIDGNSFSIENVEMFLDDSLTVQCVSGAHSKNLTINLRGGW